MNFKKFTAILFSLLAVCLSAYSQNDTVSIKTIVTKTVKYNNEYPLEKVYLHFDKPYYAVGDTIWFKAYLTTDVTINDDMTKNKHLPSTLSKVVYVDILSSKDSVVQRLKLPVIDGMAYGDIKLLKENYREGNYHVQAYTNWMRNFDPAYFFFKTIPVGTIVDKNVFNTISLSGQLKNNTAKVDAIIHYYTTDGRDYAGRKVSWRAQNSDDETLGKGKGITDSRGNINISFTTSKISTLSSALLVAGIDINNNTITNSYSLKNIVAPLDVQFFPEGGELINGIKTKVAFKAVKPDGLGAEVKGTVTDNSGAVVATIATEHLGMGVFELTPATGKTYKAAIVFADGAQTTYDLPAVKDDGMTLSVNNTDPEKIAITFSASDAFLAINKNKPIAIIGQSGQVVCYAGQTALTTKSYSATIPKSKFPSGIVKFTIFSSTGDALAERIVFVRRNDQLKIGLNTPKTTYGVRDQVNFNVTAKTADNQPALASLSVTVLDDTKVPFNENSEITILTSLLLTSELKGYIEKPNYYFNSVNDKTAADLDLLMLTQGYRRVIYKDILANKQPVIKFEPEDGIQVSGSLRTASGMPVPNGVVNFYIKNMRVSSTVNTNKEGEFKIPKLFFPDSVKAVVNARGNYNGNNLMIMVNNVSPQLPVPNINAPDEVANIDTALNPYLQNDKKVSLNSHVIKEVVITQTRGPKKASHQDFPFLVGLGGIPDHVVDGNRLTGCPSVYDCIKYILPGVTYNDNKLYITRDYNTGKKVEMAIYYDGSVVDFDRMASVDPSTIDQIEVYNNDGLSGLNKMDNTNGVLVISSKKVEKKPLNKELLNELLTPQYSAVNFTPKGYNMARAFYSPKYDATKTGVLGGDFRTTIYWNPKVMTDKNGTASFDFFNADGTGTYRAIIEGIDAYGNIGRTVYRYTVK
ncbi:carboxypeptidase regulatory-like domain-containing protein [Mucilaginibacter sp. UR6-11]|uniref:carboxypeptidase regulatory-like domain-containing protein n=1 Tax=Mucilaginibacter sp. UR6-11 TaxID=1435644 RepID=UPI001E544B69|nr:carboxypeptidase regulatory-like domain-containing protein [Mucilaginibacter sp. UR6-11]MCC8427056.1 carboxypeptidase regulatory-like domain-containing protein [Mucilaginibacter sp. UR6-11]